MNPSSRRSFLRRIATLTAAATSTGVGLPVGDREIGDAGADNLPGPGSPTLATIRQRQRLRVALLVGSAPFASVGADAAEVRALIAADPPPLHAAAGGRNVVGLDADLAAAVAQVLGVALELIPVERFESLLAPLARGEVELALGGISRTAARATVLAFSMPYLTAGQEIFSLEERRFLSLHDVNQPAIKVGVRAGSFAQAFVQRDLARVKPAVFGSAAELFAALTRRAVDVAIAEGPVGRDFALRRGLTLFSVEKRRVTSEAIAMATRQGDGDFVEFLSLFLRELRQSGDFMRLARRYNQWLRVDR
jgi:polar amino acid transport system substrate-binding protein